ncbi:MAG TPA: cytochrome c oxidase subunit II [Chthoniobacterales bacterium]|jgi:cytochrome c oxidase subunit 2|nr:cytochrome c oxidase subunit II [Chthoniobacterales bacterium]
MGRFHLFPPEASAGAGQVDWLYFGLTAMMIFFCVVVFLPIIYFSVRYRRGARVDRSQPSSGSNLLESGWTLFPLVVSLGFFTWGAVVYYHLERPPRDSLEVQVVAKQWMWKLQHAEGKKEINELHVPLGRAVTLTMTSQDVIHSFFVPAFRVKQDVVPGKYTTEWFRPTRLGEYHLFCAEYCGTNHSRMVGRVEVMEPADYERWLTTGDVGQSLASVGRRLFREKGCSGCHEGSAVVHAPPLAGVYGKQVPLNSGEVVTADDQYIRDSILLPAKQISAGYDNVMPSFTGHISEAEIMQIIAYLKSIGDQPPEAK